MPKISRSTTQWRNSVGQGNWEHVADLRRRSSNSEAFIRYRSTPYVLYPRSDLYLTSVFKAAFFELLTPLYSIFDPVICWRYWLVRTLIEHINPSEPVLFGIMYIYSMDLLCQKNKIWPRKFAENINVLIRRIRWFLMISAEFVFVTQK